MKKILLILAGLALLVSCEEFEGALTKGCQCERVELKDGTELQDVYLPKKDYDHKRVQGCDWVNKEKPLGEGSYIRCVGKTQK